MNNVKDGFKAVVLVILFAVQAAPAVARNVAGWMKRMRRILVFAGLSVSLPGWAGGPAFVTTSGPGGGSVYALFRDAAGIVYAGTNSGIYRQGVGETAWTSLGTGIRSNDRPLAIARDAAGPLYIGTDNGAYVLGNDGVWAQLGKGFPVTYTRIFNFEWDGGQLYAATSYGVYRLDVANSNWISLGMNGVYAIAFDGARTLYAGIYGGIWKLPANGQSWEWQDAGSGLPASTSVLSLAHDGAGNLLAGTENKGMFRLAAGGSTWAAVNTGAASDLTTYQMIRDSAGNILAATRTQGILKLASASTVWIQASSGLSQAGVNATLASSDGSLLAATNNGVFRATAAGAWTPDRAGLPVESVINAVAFDAAGNLYAANDTAGVSRLNAGSGTWQDLSGGAPASGIAKALTIDKAGNVYAAFFGPGVYRLAPGASNWVEINTGLNNYPVVSHLSASANDDIYAAATAIGAGSSNGVYRLPAGTSTWSQIGGALPNDPPLRTVVADTDGTVYAGASAGMTNTGLFGGVYRLAPGQSAWTEFNTGIGQREIFALTFDSAGNLYAVASGAVFVLGKGGSTWTSVVGGLPGYFFGYAGAFGFDSGGNLLMGTSEGAFMLPPGTSTWESFGTGLPARPIFSLAVNGTDYAVGISGSGVYSSAPGWPLLAGWNLLGNSSSNALFMSSAFGDQTKVTSVWKWIPGTSRWAFYAPSMLGADLAIYAASKSYDVLSTVAGGEGFWVNARTAFNATPPTGTPIASAPFASALGSGWSLISIGDNKTPRDFNNSLSATQPGNGAVAATLLTTLWAWNSSQFAWFFYAPALDNSGTLAAYAVSKSYLDFGSKTLTPGTGFWVNKP